MEPSRPCYSAIVLNWAAVPPFAQAPSGVWAETLATTDIEPRLFTGGSAHELKSRTQALPMEKTQSPSHENPVPQLTWPQKPLEAHLQVTFQTLF